jgi:hypothetical protein
MDAVVVIEHAPIVKDKRRFEHVQEELPIEQLIPKPAVEVRGVGSSSSSLKNLWFSAVSPKGSPAGCNV